MSPSALILLADGTEEMEFTITYDTLVRAGVACQSAFVLASSQSKSPDGRYIAKGSRGIGIQADILFENLQDLALDKFDALIIPGGAKGAETISQSSQVQSLVQTYLRFDQGGSVGANKYVGMICAGSLTALTSNLATTATNEGGQRWKLTSHPSVKEQLDKNFEYSEDSVVVSGKLVTSRGPGTAFPFALTLVELLCGREKREEVRGPMVFPPNTPF